MKDSADARALKVAVGTYFVLFATKLAAYSLTGVMALFAEAMHTLSDIVVSGFLLAAVYWSRKKADADHMFGHARSQNVAGLVAATLFISFTSYKLYEESIPRLFRADQSTYENLPLAITVITASMLVAMFPLIGMLRNKQRGPAARAQLRELVNDQLGLAAAMAGTLFVLWGMPLADPIASIVVATIIAVNAVGLLRENASFLQGRSPGPEFMSKVESLAWATEGVMGIHDLRGEYVGPGVVHTGFHIEVAEGTPIEEADRIAEEVKEKVAKETGCRYCVIHIDPK